MKKRKKTKKTKNGTTKLKIAVYVLVLAVIGLSTILAYILYTQKEYKKELVHTQNSLKILQAKIKEVKKITLKKETPSAQIPSEALDFTTNVKHTAQKTAHKKPKHVNLTKPKLVIIIDDVAFKYQVDMIKTIPLKITPSFFPPTNAHPNTPIYAREFNHYMIHVPMSAMHFNRPEPKTLHVNDSYAKILNRIKELKKEFPKAEFINNHTGSKFTSDTDAMFNLFKALQKERLGFVDSKTTLLTKAKTADAIYPIPLYTRNVFLDNVPNRQYIRNELKRAVNIAKKDGFAIAIGHPHKTTLNTLKTSNDILKGVDVVYIDELRSFYATK